MGKEGGPKGGKVVTDSRFAAVHHDPRFQRFPKAKAKVEIDERFAGMFKEDAFQVRAAVDKRGRKVKGSRKNEDMRRYYRLKGEEEAAEAARLQRLAAGEASEGEPEGEAEEAEQQQQQKAKGKAAKAAPAKGKQQQQRQQRELAPPSSGEDELHEEEGSEPGSSSDDEDLDPEERAAQERWARMRGLAGPDSSSSEEEGSEEEAGSGSEEEDEEQEEGGSEDEDEDGDEDEKVFRQRRPVLPRRGTAEEEEEPLNEEDLEEWGVGALAANPEEPIPLLPDATRRLAAVDLDWDHVRAVDILAVLRSFVPKGGAIQRVVVYPSDYGLERMAKEAVMGPQGIFKPAAPKGGGKRQGNGAAAVAAGSDSEEEEEEEEIWEEGMSSEEEEEEEEIREEGMSSEEEEEGAEGGSSSESEGGEVDQRRLRLYERSKLRYYYAIITCDTAATANRLYEECDGMEFMKTACKFDLRFVPDEQSFKGRQVRDEAADVPTDYAPPAFQARALQHTNVQLTWDADDDSRKRALTRKVTAEELKEDDFKAYLASDSEGSGEDSDAGGAEEEDEEAIRERYRRLLLGGDADVATERQGKKDWGAGSGSEEGSEEGGSDGEGGSGGEEGEAAVGGKKGGRARGKSDKDMEMEVTFLPGLENLGQRLLAKKREEEARKGETVWEAYMRRKREKKAEAKRKGRKLGSDESDSDYDEPADGSDSEGELPAGVADDPFFQQEEDPFNDPFFKDGPDADAAEAEEAAAAGKGGRRGKQQQQRQQQEQEKGKKGKGKKGKQGEEQLDAAKQAELEMILMDDAALLAAARGGGGGATAPAGNAQQGQGQGQQAAAKPKLSRKERIRQKKEAKRRERQEGSDEEDAAAGEGGGFRGVDLSDPRFAELLTSHHYALDPTDPRYKDTSANVAAEVAKRRSQTTGAAGCKQPAAAGKSQQQNGGAGKGGASSGSGKADTKLLVAVLKRKMGAQGGSGSGSGGGSKKAAAAPVAAAAGGQPNKKKQRMA
ncbi:Pre-rRNA-processing esf1 [Chlorella sorokiniana]|uniref:Pre-rRNA-processing esf1 n=1 Tax=Chlorella sorokiniana TaxID=3076 RepID=A0A2P6TZ94_CHLSO|nr:Pre-rRNA-processing esf1 [Chlorella sorokiniana]|eukprot:PRW59387.1 Pre-rRNA-processing esf1 [Chlorella sorokiniana]